MKRGWRRPQLGGVIGEGTEMNKPLKNDLVFLNRFGGPDERDSRPIGVYSGTKREDRFVLLPSVFREKVERMVEKRKRDGKLRNSQRRVFHYRGNYDIYLANQT